MAGQEQNGHGDRWQPTPSVTQADRSVWQRQAAGTLCAIVVRHCSLPAIRWSVTRTGSVCGQVIGQASPHATVATFARWREALRFGDYTESLGASGIAHLRARADWGLVRITLAANAAVGEGADAGPGAATVGGHLTISCRTAVGYLVRILDEHPDLDALTWAVLPSGDLAARVGRQQSGNATRAVFREWESTLGLEPEQAVTAGRVIRQVGLAQEGTVAVLVKATIIERPSGHVRHRLVGSGRPGIEARPARPATQARRQQVPGAAGQAVHETARDGVHADHEVMLPHQNPQPSAGPPGPVPSP
jgi:hypothetical protein